MLHPLTFSILAYPSCFIIWVLRAGHNTVHQNPFPNPVRELTLKRDSLFYQCFDLHLLVWHVPMPTSSRMPQAIFFWNCVLGEGFTFSAHKPRQFFRYLAWFLLLQICWKQIYVAISDIFLSDLLIILIVQFFSLLLLVEQLHRERKIIKSATSLRYAFLYMNRGKCEAKYKGKHTKVK